MLYRHVIFDSNLYVVNLEQRCIKKYRCLYTVVLIFDSSEFLKLVMEFNLRVNMTFSVIFLCVRELFYNSLTVKLFDHLLTKCPFFTSDIFSFHKFYC